MRRLFREAMTELAEALAVVLRARHPRGRCVRRLGPSSFSRARPGSPMATKGLHTFGLEPGRYDRSKVSRRHLQTTGCLLPPEQSREPTPVASEELCGRSPEEIVKRRKRECCTLTLRRGGYDLG